MANGDTKAAKLYNVATLSIKPMSTEYYEKIIRGGGPAVGKAPYMPPWQDELSNEQIKDVVAYLGVVSNAVGRGEVVFKTNCVLCHGVKGDGKGRASVLFDPPPANLTRSDKNDEYKTMIITMGGAAMGRSPVMPVWGEQLSTQEINDVVAYLRTILVK
jgi:cytochrome c oxidase cbb3-type subunit 3